ncbi:MAG: glycosyltransferase family 1 protein [Chloroflexota bacterium]|nr:MAG: glycosyltransferase family 1 protein [Chloroflexota bacterium]
MAKNGYLVAVVEWISEEDGLANAICDELIGLGHCTHIVRPKTSDPGEADVVFTFGPYGNYLAVVSHLAGALAERRPIFVHWNTEGMPDPRLPWALKSAVGAGRSWIGRLDESYNGRAGSLVRGLTSSWQNRILRFRYLGDYHYAYRKGWLDVFSDSSAVYADLHRQHGLPTITAPWGATKRWYADLGLERDIDVLWLGQRGSRRRGQLLDHIRQELLDYNVKVHVIDNEENPFVFGRKRTEVLNRAKITLNLTRTWFDDNFSRFAMAAPNRSLIVSEPLLPHCPSYEAGVHYVSECAEDLAQTILYYLEHDDERQRIVDSAYELTTGQLTFRNSIAQIMQAVDQVRGNRTA